MVKIKIVSLEKKDLYWLSAVLFLIVIIGVIAYNDFSHGVPSTMGHSSDEIMVNVGGVQKSLQAAITDGSIASGVKIQEGYATDASNIYPLSGFTKSECNFIVVNQRNYGGTNANNYAGPVSFVEVDYVNRWYVRCGFYDGGNWYARDNCRYLMICRH